MAILQENKQKVQPVMDYHEPNKHVNGYMANADMCAQTMWEWRQQGQKAAIVDLRRAYLQIHIDKSLRPFQTVKIKGQRYCLTRLGFGQNVAPQIMRSVVKAVIGQDETVSSATFSYVDDIFVNESVCSAAQVKTHLELFGLTCKDPEQLSSGARVLGVYVWEEHCKLQRRASEGSQRTYMSCRLFCVWAADRAFSSLQMALCCSCICETESKCRDKRMGQ